MRRRFFALLSRHRGGPHLDALDGLIIIVPVALFTRLGVLDHSAEAHGLGPKVKPTMMKWAGYLAFFSFLKRCFPDDRKSFSHFEIDDSRRATKHG